MKKLFSRLLVILLLVLLAAVIFTPQYSGGGNGSAEAFRSALGDMLGELEQRQEQLSRMTDDELRAGIIEIASSHGVELTEKQIGQLMKLCRSVQNLDPEAIHEKYTEAVQKFTRAREGAAGFFADLRSTIRSVGNFFDALGGSRG